MKFIDEYRDPKLARALVAEIAATVTRPWVLMEICGGQTHTLMRYGIDELLPPRLELVHGPGCPVCVTPLETVDRAIAIAAHPGVILVSYGDMLRVPGSASDLFRVKAEGGDVRIAYSPMDAVAIAAPEPRAPGGVLRGRLRNHRAGQRHGRLAGGARRPEELFHSGLARPGASGGAPAARLPRQSCAGLHRPGTRLRRHGLHANTKNSPRDFHVPFVVGGFEPLDLLEAILMLVRQLEAGPRRSGKSVRALA